MAIEYRQQNGNGNSTGTANAGGSTSAASASNAGSSVTTASGANASGNATSSQVFGITGGPGFNPNATHISIPANGNPGMAVITQPPLQSTSYYKIAAGETITIAWNYTDLAVTPTSITLSAVCDNGNTYPVGPSNGVFPGNVQNVTWSPYAYQTDHPNLPLAQAGYTLLLYRDSPSAPPTPGYLEVNNQLRLYLYTPQAYTPLASGWSCGGGCGGALEQFKAHPASIALITTLLIVFLSGFTTLRRVWD